MDMENEQQDEDCEIDLTNISSDELLIAAKKGYLHLFDKKDKNFKDQKMKDNSWGEISELMNLSGKNSV